MRQEKQKFESARTPEEANKLIHETIDEGKKLLQ